MPLFDPNLRGRYLKLGPHGWQKLGNVARAVRGNDAQGPHIIVHRRGGPPLIYRGHNAAERERVKAALEREGIGE